MNLIMLGTGNALVTECYNTCFVLRKMNQYFMVDGGGGNANAHFNYFNGGNRNASADFFAYENKTEKFLAFRQ